MKHGVPCTSGWGDCLSTAVKDSVSIGVPPRAPRSAGAVMFMSATCDRHEGYAPPLKKNYGCHPARGMPSACTTLAKKKLVLYEAPSCVPRRGQFARAARVVTPRGSVEMLLVAHIPNPKPKAHNRRIPSPEFRFGIHGKTVGIHGFL
jgi:hypothetical protein